MSTGAGAATDSSRIRWEWRARFYSVAVIVAIVAVVVVESVLAGASEAPADRIGGDYPAFYGAGRIAATGDWDDLYSFDRQVEAQADLYTTEAGEQAWFFAYPPQVAAIYRPLAAIEYNWSYLVHTILMMALLWASALLVRPMVPWMRGRVSFAVALALLFWPMFRAVTGGSNTALTLFLIASVWRLIHDNNEVAAGVVLAGLFYKPQFAVPLVGLFLIAGYWRVVAGALAGAGVFYAAGAATQGWNWGMEWFAAARDFGRVDAEVNGHSSISLVGMAENLFGVGWSLPVILGWLLAAAVALFLAWLWWTNGLNDLAGVLAFTLPGILLLSPHAMSHDGAIVVLAVAIIMSLRTTGAWILWAGLIWILGASQVSIRQLGFSPGLLMLVIVIAGAWVAVGVPRPWERTVRGRGLHLDPSSHGPAIPQLRTPTDGDSENLLDPGCQARQHTPERPFSNGEFPEAP